MLVVGKTVAFGFNKELDSGWKGKKKKFLGTCDLLVGLTKTQPSASTPG